MQPDVMPPTAATKENRSYDQAPGGLECKQRKPWYALSVSRRPVPGRLLVVPVAGKPSNAYHTCMVPPPGGEQTHRMRWGSEHSPNPLSSSLIKWSAQDQVHA